MIIASTYNVDPKSEIDLNFPVVGLRETPSPGDTIRLKDGQRIRVIRREFNQRTGDDDSVDVVLGVRLA